MKIIIVKPQEKPFVTEIESSLGAMQEVMGGYIQAVCPFEDPVALVCNEEGKLLGLTLNRALRATEDTVCDIIAGTFFLCGAPLDSDHFTSLTEEQTVTYLHRFWFPEYFL